MPLFSNDLNIESPQFGTDVSSGGPVAANPMEAYQPIPGVSAPPVEPRSKSIMERMRELTATLTTPTEEGNFGTSILGRLSRGMVGFSEGYQGRGGQFLRNIGEQDEQIRQRNLERAKLGLDVMKEQRAGQKEAREAKKEDLKNKAYEQLGEFDFSDAEMKSGKKLGSVVSTLLQAGDHATAAGLIKMVQEASKSEKMRDQLNTTTNRLKLAKSREEADEILLEMPPELAKEHHGWLGNVVKSRFGGDEKEKSLNTNDLIAFVESKGRLRGPTVPKDMTVEEARSTVASQRSMQQQQINVNMGQQQFQRASSIKDDYTRQVKDYEASRVNQRKFEDIFKGGNKEGSKIKDLALVRQGMMAMDPPNAPSIVRESEAELIERAKANNLLQPLSFHLERLQGKRTLTNEQRDQIAEIVRQGYNARRAGYQEQRKIYGEFATSSGLNPEQVLGKELPPIISQKGKKAEGPASDKEKRLKALGF